jgi:hypothetical protein
MEKGTRPILVSPVGRGTKAKPGSPVGKRTTAELGQSSVKRNQVETRSKQWEEEPRPNMVYISNPFPTSHLHKSLFLFEEEAL